MARKPRIEFPGGCYHIMSRGNHQEAIFLDDRDRGMFLDTLEEACERTGWRIHAYVLMGNHYHLLLETPEPNLVTGMKWLQGTYTQRFNARHRLRGHLFQGRYKSPPVQSDNEGYFLTVADYIHLNPARARLFDLEHGTLRDYPWSSYLHYLRPSRRPSWLQVDRVLGNLHLRDDRSGRTQFARHLERRVIEVRLSDCPWEVDAAWAGIRRGWAFGGPDFRDQLLERLHMNGRRENYSGEAVRLHDEREAERLLTQGLRVLGLKPSLLADLPISSSPKCLLCWLLRRHTAVSNAWISEHLHMGRPDCLGRYPRRIEASKDKKVVAARAELERITRKRD